MKNKILIYTKSIDEITDNVTDWLEYKGSEVLRLNSQELIKPNIQLSLSREEGYTLKINSIDLSNIYVFWFRKGGGVEFGKHFSKSHINRISDKYISSFLIQESIALRDTIHKFCYNTKTINYNALFGFNKIHNLNIAVQSGLRIPATLITSLKHEIENFKNKHKKIITKPISENLIFKDDVSSYSFYTSEISNEVIQKKNDVLFPVLLQEKIEKEYEIRVFFLNDIIYSMAIISTEMDYRKDYDSNRYLLYKLPKDIEESIRIFMEAMKLETGMIDLIKSDKGEYIFLEVNPSGEFSDMSQYCNFYLEDVFATQLIKMTNNG